MDASSYGGIVLRIIAHVPARRCGDLYRYRRNYFKTNTYIGERRIERFFAPDLYLTFVHYQGIMGFGEDWKTLYVQTETGGIYIVPISLQFLSHRDKMKVLEALNRYKNT